MKYLLDTCVISELLKEKPNSRVLEWVNARAEFDLCISALTLGELLKGVHLLSEGKKKRSLAIWILEVLSERFADRILPISDEIAAQWGNMVASSIQAGTPLPVIDSLILATAMTHRLTFVTRNVSDFQGFDVKITNPWS